MDLHRPTGAWYFRGLHQARAFTIGIILKFELLSVRSYAEMDGAKVAPATLAEAVLRGGYPVLYDAQRPIDPIQWLEDYLSTFVNRDIRQIIEVKNRTAFDRFVRLCAARTGQLLNTAGLGRDCGVDNKTAASWLSVLEECYLIRLIHPYSRNFGKRLVKSPKLHFIDTGIACRLLHISNVNQLVGHHQWGALVETWCVGEAIKTRLNQGLRANAWHWRSSDGLEIDLVFETGTSLHPIEIKGAVTAQRDDADSIGKFRRLSADEPTLTVEPGAVIYGGDERRPVGADRFVPWFAVHEAVPGQP
jgi:predicted AAA+ superfamily ATPase